MITHLDVSKRDILLPYFSGNLIQAGQKEASDQGDWVVVVIGKAQIGGGLTLVHDKHFGLYPTHNRGIVVDDLLQGLFSGCLVTRQASP